MDNYSYKRNKTLVFVSIIVWFIMSALQGAGILGNTIEPKVGSFPFSIFYLFCMGIWGVINAVLLVKIFSPSFFKKIEENDLSRNK